jgi:hypothetical protein
LIRLDKLPVSIYQSPPPAPALFSAQYPFRRIDLQTQHTVEHTKQNAIVGLNLDSKAEPEIQPPAEILSNEDWNILILKYHYSNAILH